MSDLLGARVVHMTDEELQAHTLKIRHAREVPATFRTLLKGKEKVARKAPKIVANSDSLFD